MGPPEVRVVAQIQGDGASAGLGWREWTVVLPGESSHGVLPPPRGSWDVRVSWEIRITMRLSAFGEDMIGFHNVVSLGQACRLSLKDGTGGLGCSRSSLETSWVSWRTPPGYDRGMDHWIRIRGARQHNLKNLDLDLPRRVLTVITGPSGSGKSSLALDTLFAEGQRRYVESLSTYAKQFLDRMEKPLVDLIEGICSGGGHRAEEPHQDRVDPRWGPPRRSSIISAFSGPGSAGPSARNAGRKSGPTPCPAPSIGSWPCPDGSTNPGHLPPEPQREGDPSAGGGEPPGHGVSCGSWPTEPWWTWACPAPKTRRLWVWT